MTRRGFFQIFGGFSTGTITLPQSENDTTQLRQGDFVRVGDVITFETNLSSYVDSAFDTKRTFKVIGGRRMEQK